MHHSDFKKELSQVNQVWRENVAFRQTGILLSTPVDLVDSGFIPCNETGSSEIIAKAGPSKSKVSKEMMENGWYNNIQLRNMR